MTTPPWACAGPETGHMAPSAAVTAAASRNLMDMTGSPLMGGKGPGQQLGAANGSRQLVRFDYSITRQEAAARLSRMPYSPAQRPPTVRGCRTRVARGALRQNGMTFMSLAHKVV